MERPYIKFFTSDWRGDVRLRSVSLAARGLWKEMLCIMAEAKPYGHLIAAGIRYSEANLEALSLQVGASKRDVSAAFSELKRAEVFGVLADGTIYSRRMVRDEKIRLLKVEAGKRGAEVSNYPRVTPPASAGATPPAVGSASAAAHMVCHSPESIKTTNVVGKPEPSLLDMSAYRIMDSAWPIINGAHKLIIKRDTWRKHNKAAAKELVEAGKSAEDVAEMLLFAFEDPEASRFYGGITTLAKIVEHWPKLEKMRSAPTSGDASHDAYVHGEYLRQV